MSSTSDPRDPLAGQRVLVTGATGFIGGHLARRLLGGGVQVRALVRDPARADGLDGAELIRGDLAEGVAGVAEGCTVVFHAAAAVSSDGDAAWMHAVNVDGTGRLLDEALRVGVGRFVHLSSCAVYGSPQRMDVDETAPLVLRVEPYADSKLQADQLVQHAAAERGLPAVIARPSQVYGPGSPQFTLRPVRVIKSGSMVLVDGGRHLFKPVYIDDLIDGLVLCAVAKGVQGEAINLTEGRAYPWKQLFGAYARMLGVPHLRSVPYPVAWLAGWWAELRARGSGRPPGLSRGAVRSLRSDNSFSNSKARELLGWEPRVDLVEGLRRTEAWLDEQGLL